MGTLRNLILSTAAIACLAGCSSKMPEGAIEIGPVKVRKLAAEELKPAASIDDAIKKENIYGSLAGRMRQLYTRAEWCVEKGAYTAAKEHIQEGRKLAEPGEHSTTEMEQVLLNTAYEDAKWLSKSGSYLAARSRIEFAEELMRENSLEYNWKTRLSELKTKRYTPKWDCPLK